MSSLQQIKKRVFLVKNSKKVTNALQMISVAKMKHARELLQNIQFYSDAVVTFMQKIAHTAHSADLDAKTKQFFKSPNKKAHALLVLFAPTKGFCGALISSLHAYVNTFIQEKNHRVGFKSIGLQYKSKFILESLNDMIVDAVFEDPVGDKTRFELEAQFQFILKGYFSGDYSEVYLIYPKYIDVFTYKPVYEQLLPLSPAVFEAIFKHDKSSSSKQRMPNNTLDMSEEQAVNQLANDIQHAEIEPSVEILFKEALERYLINRLMFATINTKASEFSARSIAMKNATENADALEQSLQLEFNKKRQELITSNLLDIMGAIYGTK